MRILLSVLFAALLICPDVANGHGSGGRFRGKSPFRFRKRPTCYRVTSYGYFLAHGLTEDDSAADCKELFKNGKPDTTTQAMASTTEAVTEGTTAAATTGGPTAGPTGDPFTGTTQTPTSECMRLDGCPTEAGATGTTVGATGTPSGRRKRDAEEEDGAALFKGFANNQTFLEMFDLGSTGVVCKRIELTNLCSYRYPRSKKVQFRLVKFNVGLAADQIKTIDTEDH